MGCARIAGGIATQRHSGHQKKKRLFCLFFGLWQSGRSVYIEVFEKSRAWHAG
jgi:hypothetical protein